MGQKYPSNLRRTFTLILFNLVVGFSSCAKDDPDPTSAESTSEMALSSASGAVATSEGTSGAQAFLDFKKSGMSSFVSALSFPTSSAFADTTACPTLFTAFSDSLCSGGSMTLTYQNCSFKKLDGISFHGATWNGSQIISFKNSTGIVTCPSSLLNIALTNYTMTRTVGAGTTRLGLNGVTVSIDTATASGWDTSVTPQPSGGTTIIFSGGDGTRNVSIKGIHLVASKTVKKKGKDTAITVWDHTISSVAEEPLSITKSGTERTITTGTVVVQHNILLYTAKAAFSGVKFDPTTCGCLPTAGTITTQLSGSKTGTETLTITGCGTATIQDSTGAKTDITLNHCI